MKEIEEKDAALSKNSMMNELKKIKDVKALQEKGSSINK